MKPCKFADEFDLYVSTVIKNVGALSKF